MAKERMTAIITIRLPESLRAAVEDAAAAEDRTVSNWILTAIKQRLAQQAEGVEPRQHDHRQGAG